MDDNLYFDTSTANLDTSIPSDQSRALPPDVKDQYIFNNYSSIGTLVGTMPIDSNEYHKIDPKPEDENIPINNEYVIPKGYHDGTGKVYVGDLSEYTYATVNAEPDENDVARNKVFYVNGKRKIGTLNMSGLNQDATAEASDILEDKTAWVNGVLLHGTIEKLSRRDVNLVAGASFTIPKGYHYGTSIVSAVSLEDQTRGTAEASDIISGKVAWVDGTEIIGTLNFDSVIIDRLQDTDALRNQVLAGKKFYSNVYRTIDIGNMPDHTGEGMRFINIGERYYIPEGYYNGQSYVITKTLTEATEASAEPDDILQHKTAWVNGHEITGTMEYIVEYVRHLSAGEECNIPKGYHNGQGKIICDSIDYQTRGTATASDILLDETAWVNGVKITGTLEFNGDANLNDVLEGKTFYSYDPHTIIQGSMPNNGAVNKELSASESYTIPKGYHNGQGVVIAKSLEDQTDGDAESTNILSGKTAGVNGVKLTGEMPNRGAISEELNADASFTIPEGYHNGQGTVHAKSISSQTDGTATVNDIVYGKTAWVNGHKLVGAIPRLVRPNPPIVLLAGSSHTVPFGLSQGDIEIEAESLDVQTPGDARSSDILEDKTAWVEGVQITGNIPKREKPIVRVMRGHNVTLPAGYYSSDIVIYTLFEDRLDLTGTDASVVIESNSLNPNDSGYIDESTNSLVVTAEFTV